MRHDYGLCLSFDTTRRWRCNVTSVLPWGAVSSGTLDPLKVVLGICVPFNWKNVAYVRWYAFSVIYIQIIFCVLVAVSTSYQFNQNKSTYNWHFGKCSRSNASVGIVNVHETFKFDLIIPQAPYGPPDYFRQLLNKSTFAWLLHVVVLLYTRNLSKSPQNKVVLVIWF